MDSRDNPDRFGKQNRDGNFMKIFITRPIPQVGVQKLKDKGYEVVINEAARERAATLDELKEGAKGADALLSILTDKITAEVMDAGLPTLKVIANYAVGFDNINVGAAKQKNMPFMSKGLRLLNMTLGLARAGA